MEEYKYLEVEISKKLFTTVYLKVPKNFDNNISSIILSKAAEETCDRMDWDDYGWEETIEWENIKEVSEKTANEYKVYVYENR